MEIVSFIDPASGSKLYCIGPFSERAQASRAAAGIERASSPASRKPEGSITKRARAIFDLLGAGKSRRELIAECERQGINKGTAATQYQKWKKAGAAA